MQVEQERIDAEKKRVSKPIILFVDSVRIDIVETYSYLFLSV
jgi:hypothetical protein